MTTATALQNEAATKYAEQHGRCKELLELIEVALEERQRGVRGKLNWGDVGDAGRALLLLAETAAGLGVITSAEAFEKFGLRF